MIRSRRSCAVTIAGFSLVELLVALVLLGMVFLVLFNSLALGLKIWNANDQELSSNTQALVARDLLRRVLSEARPLKTTLGAPNAEHRVFFLGTQDSIRFVAPMPSHLAVGGLYEIAIYAIEGGQTGNRLEMSWRLFRRQSWPSKPLTEEKRSELISKVAEIEFNYFGQVDKSEPPGWHVDWQNLQSLPELIRLRLKFVGGEGAWPDLVVAPMVQSVNLVYPVPE